MPVPRCRLPLIVEAFHERPAGKLYRGRVVPDGTGTYCATDKGLFGPGAEQSIGMPCTISTKLGTISGRVSP